MRVKLTEPDFDRLIEILQALPDFGLADKRVDFVGDVFYASKRQQDILGHLDLAGTPHAVAVRLINRLLHFGQDKPGREVLSLLIVKLLTYIGEGDDAQARRELANANLRRQRDLARQNFISPSAVEGREQEVKSADAALQGAQANLQAARQEVQRLQAEGAAAERQRQNTRLLAPAAAVVISRDAEPGSTVVAGQPVLRLANPASLWVKLRVDQSRSAGLQTGLPAQIVLRSDARQTLAGRVQRVELQADAVTEERIAQVAFDQIPATLSMGEMAEVTLTLPPLEQVLVVPQASVQTYQGRSGVWRLEQGTLAFAPVRLGASSLQGQVQVLDGLQTDDTVVVYSEKPLSPGARFRVVDRLVRQGKP